MRNVTGEMIGKRYGHLTVLRSGDTINGKSTCLCSCSCGRETIVLSNNLRKGHTVSCGHLRGGQITHGLSETLAYGSWRAMKQRCMNPLDDHYNDYGGRGVAIIPEWLEFAAFYRDMGERPEGMSLDRIDNDGNYEPSNCKWSTQKEQTNNRRPRRRRIK